MTFSEEFGLGSLAALGTIGSVCAILLRSTHQNLKTLDLMRREASAAAEKLRQELHDHDDTIFKLQGLCADYRYAIAKLEAERDLLRRGVLNDNSLNDKNANRSESGQDPHPPAAGTRPSARPGHKFKRKPEDVL